MIISENSFGNTLEVINSIYNGFEYCGQIYRIDFYVTINKNDGLLYAISTSDFNDRIRIDPRIPQKYVLIYIH